MRAEASRSHETRPVHGADCDLRRHSAGGEAQEQVERLQTLLRRDALKALGGGMLDQILGTSAAFSSGAHLCPDAPVDA